MKFLYQLFAELCGTKRVDDILAEFNHKVAQLQRAEERNNAQAEQHRRAFMEADTESRRAAAVRVRLQSLIATESDD